MENSGRPRRAREGKLLAELAQQSGLSVDAVGQGDATETHLNALQSPWILHLATHGFFLPEEKESEQPGLLGEPSSNVIVNPMLRSGLALAGAQSTLEQWRQGKAPNPDSDGILTAEEAGTLHL